MRSEDELRRRIGRGAWIALAVGLLGLLACAAGWVVARPQLFRSWLWAFLFWTGLGVGCAGVAMLHHLVGGGWGFAVRRLLEAGARTAFLFPILFLPVWAGLDVLYPWTHEALPAKEAYLNKAFFLARSFGYIAIWMLGAWLLARASFRQDRTRDRAARHRLQRLSGPGLLVYGFTLTFAAVDWAMSLEPHWLSSIYGLLFLSGQLLSTFALAAVAAALVRAYAPFGGALSGQRLHDLGNLLFMSVLLWAYVNFSQFLLIWSGNLPEEVTWYLARARGSWGVVALALLALHFALPFLLLLDGDLKRSPRALGAVAGLVLVLRLVDLFWLVAPSFFPAGLQVHWLDAAAPAAIGGLWTAAWLFFLRRAPLLPLGDPRFAAEEVAHG